jgi:hypothetical protein
VLRCDVARSNVEENKKKLDYRSHQICFAQMRDRELLRNILNR